MQDQEKLLKRYLQRISKHTDYTTQKPCRKCQVLEQELLQRNKEQLNDLTNDQYKSEGHQRWIKKISKINQKRRVSKTDEKLNQ